MHKKSALPSQEERLWQGQKAFQPQQDSQVHTDCIVSRNIVFN